MLNTHEATELYLYAICTSELYPRRQAVEATLKRKKSKGTYDPDKALKVWYRFAEIAAKAYSKEFGAGGVPWYSMFPPSVRREVAADLEAFFISQGTIDEPGC